MNKQTFLILYFIGFILTYILCKIIRGKEENTWEDVIFTFFVSLLSFMGLLTISIWMLYTLINKDIQKFDRNKKAPKWL